MKREEKLKIIFSTAQLAQHLRDMAEAMENGKLRFENFEQDWKAVEKFDFSLRNAAGMAELKLKISSKPQSFQISADQPEHGAEDAAPAGKTYEDYDALKQRMKKSFKNIMYSLHDNTWPSQGDIEDFLHDCAEMVLYPGKGEEFYPDFTEAVAAFGQSVQDQDLEGAYRAAHLLNTLKTQCHKKYD